MRKTIMIVDDEPSIRSSLAGVLEDEGYRVVASSNGAEALKSIEEQMPDLVLLDIWMPGMDGIETLKKIRSYYPGLQVVMISGHGTIETAVTATKLGAFDFIEKPLSLEKTLLSIQNALNFRQLKDDNIILRQKAERDYKITGSSPAIRQLRETIERVAPTQATVLITGENGTGKELVARAIHRLSPRSNRPLVEVNCAAIPEELIESELFGHEKGAFTGANERRRGRFDLANNGTLLLDEIGDMSLKTQAKILRILQEQHFERVGGTKTIQVDVRIIAATNKNLEQRIKEGRFRQDLYYRLNVIPIHVPPLRERSEDIPLLVEDFIQEFTREGGLKEKHFSEAAIEVMKRQQWPGNVRELKNFVERLVILVPDDIIDTPHLPESFLQGCPTPQTATALDQPTFRQAKAEFEKEYLRKKLEEHNWNISQTAESIGLERSHLHRKIKAYGVQPIIGRKQSASRSPF
ncbi:MAG: sigma-54-dependent Fis family transcriptional regulator [Deltaproteobacteria bacterium]|nr:sigma-54-dependent Fis family transcriptional regulator [Deltaproteobacteria bacterium]MBW2071230.1 sigma-54-dependent Fis family transcriptional regulator [Deltaproteobacteria bacterium]